MENNLLSYLESAGGKPDNITWDELGSRFGISGNAARKRYGRYLQATMADDEEVSPVERVVPVVEDESWNLPKIPAGFKIRSVWGDPAKPQVSLEKGGSDFDIEQAFKQIVESTQDIRPISVDGPESPTSDVYILFSSDKHVGAKIKEDTMYKDIVYNKDMFEYRMDALLRDTVKKAEACGGFTEFCLFDLGDAVDGFDGQTTRGGHDLPQNMTSEQQFDEYVNYHISFFKTLISKNIASKYRFVCASNSNHGGAADYVCMQAVALVLKAMFPDVFEYQVSREFISHMSYEIAGEKYAYLFTHGKDKEDRSRGLPLHVNPQTENYLNSLIEYFGYTRKDHVTVVKGDLHQGCVEWKDRFDIVTVPSVFGSSDWVINNFGYTRPGAYYHHLKSDGVSSGFINLPPRIK